MKKYIYGLMVLALSFASCTDQEEIEISYKAQLTISAAHIFDSYRPTNDNDFALSSTAGGTWSVNLHSFIYDEKGSLIDKFEGSYNSIDISLVAGLALTPGKYTIISIAEFSGVHNGENYKFWNILNEDNLKELLIKESDKLVDSPLETLGITTSEVTIGDKVENINIDIKPITGLVQMIVWDNDLTGAGENGFSFSAPYINELTIYAPQIKQIVKFEGKTPVYDYGSQVTYYPMKKHSPRQQFLNSGSKSTYSYRALLPIENRDFYWTLKTIQGAGQYLFADKKDEQTSDMTENKINVEPGKQYVMDLLLDGFMLYVNDYDKEIDLDSRINDLKTTYNKSIIKKELKFEYEKFIGWNRATIESYLDKEPFYTTETTTSYLGQNLISYIIIRFDDENMQKANRVMLGWIIDNNEMFDLVTECLKELYTPWEKGTTATVKTFINGATLEDATVGIAWDSSNYCLYFDLI